MNRSLSIITINYNNADGLRQTIKSVIGQTCYDSIEYIIVDDGSTDGSVEVIREYWDRLSFWTSRPNKGIYATMNEGVRHASCQYCVFLNSGDCYRDEHVIEKILPLLDGKFDFIIGRLMFNNTGLLSQTGKDLSLMYFLDSCLPQNTAFVKRALLNKHPFDETYRIASDLKFFVETIVIDNASYKYIDQVIVNYDCNGISSTRRDLAKKEQYEILQSLIPERVLSDYIQFTKGQGYKNTPYDSFFIKLKDYKYSDVLYTVCVLIMKFIGMFRKGASFAKYYPNKYR